MCFLSLMTCKHRSIKKKFIIADFLGGCHNYLVIVRRPFGTTQGSQPRPGDSPQKEGTLCPCSSAHSALALAYLTAQLIPDSSSELTEYETKIDYCSI